MDDLNFTSRIELKQWLADKPPDWGQIIAVRAALRAFPYLSRASIEWREKFVSVPMRALMISWIARNVPAIHVTKHASEAAAREANLVPGNAQKEGALSTTLAVDSAYLSALVAVSQPETASKIAHNVAQAVKSSAEAAANFIHNEHEIIDGGISITPLPRSHHGYILNAMWQAASADCRWLSREGKPSQAARRLTGRKLWLNGFPTDWIIEWDRLDSHLFSIDRNYLDWLVWYDRRIRGERSAFDIPGDKGRIEDKKILRRLAEATDEDFWGKGHEYVNVTLKGWLDEACARVAPPPDPDIREAVAYNSIGSSMRARLERLEDIAAPPQESGAIAYGVNEQGKLDRLPNSDQVHLRDVPDQRRAYDDLREAAAELRDEGQRLGHRLGRALGRFLQSLPERFEDAEAYLVWRDANALRRQHRAHREASKSSEPDDAKLEPVIAEQLGGLLDLYNNFAFADDGLRAKDEARIPPQERADQHAEATASSELVAAILQDANITTERAQDDLRADIESAEFPADDPFAVQALDQSNRTKRNIFAGLLEGARKAVSNPSAIGFRATKGVIYGGGTAIGVAVGGFVVGNYTAILEYVAQNATLLNQYVGVAFSSYPQLPDLIERIRVYWLSASGKRPN